MFCENDENTVFPAVPKDPVHLTTLTSFSLYHPVLISVFPAYEDRTHYSSDSADIEKFCETQICSVLMFLNFDFVILFLVNNL